MAKQTVGGFVTAQLAQLKRKVAATHNEGGFYSIYADAARRLLTDYPELDDQQRAQVFASFERDVELTKMRTGMDYSNGLGSAARILGLRKADAKEGVYPSVMDPNF
jgi:hypothetical protein